jgi:C-terminal processing protease CtpA/Prc
VTYELAWGIYENLLFIIDEWNSGRQITEPNYLLGIGPLPPYPRIRYTKPILVLVNHLDFSGGDFFPAILQDNKRAAIMGTHTAGAGGYVGKVSFPNLNGIAYFSYTASIAERTNHRPLENLGVTPDIHYEITENDLHNNYRSYSAEILKNVQTLYEAQGKKRNEWWKFLSSKRS